MCFVLLVGSGPRPDSTHLRLKARHRVGQNGLPLFLSACRGCACRPTATLPGIEDDAVVALLPRLGSRLHLLDLAGTGITAAALQAIADWAQVGHADNCGSGAKVQGEHHNHCLTKETKEREPRVRRDSTICCLRPDLYPADLALLQEHPFPLRVLVLPSRPAIQRSSWAAQLKARPGLDVRFGSSGIRWAGLHESPLLED